MPHNWIQNTSDRTKWKCSYCLQEVSVKEHFHPVELLFEEQSRRNLDLSEQIERSANTGIRTDKLNIQECVNSDVMIQYMKIDNFKSLSGFSLQLSKFNCLIGLNGAGKTTMLQAFDFISHIMVPSLKKTEQFKDWLENREWTTSDLVCNCRIPKKQLITFEIFLSLPSSQLVKWEAAFNPNLMRCTSETVTANGKVLLKVSDSMVSVAGERAKTISFDYQGSVLSRLKGSILEKTPVLSELKDFFANIKSLELLSPHQMRQRARDATDIGSGGEKLSAFLHTLSPEKHSALQASLKEYYPGLLDFKTSALRSGWKKLLIYENYSKGKMETEARHINDGMLRLLAILAQTKTAHRFLLFDEIENGINPELIEKLVQQLLTAPQQVMVTTHSPMILNYLPDDVAKESVILLYKTRQGITRCKRYFDIPDTANKLKALGPGEVFVDTDMTALVQQLEQAETPQ